MGRGSNVTAKLTKIILIPFFIWIIAFGLIPVLSMLFASFRGEGGQGFTLGQYHEILTNPLYMDSLKNSIYVALFSSIIGILIALFSAYSITRFPEKIRDRFLMITNMVSNFAGVPLAFSYMVLLGGAGMVTVLFQKIGWDALASFDLYTWTGLIVVYVYVQVPLSILLLYPAYYGLKEEWREASSLLGASNFQFWRYIGIPVISPAVIGTFSVLFANALGAYATAYALSISFNLAPIRITKLVSGDVFLRPELGSALSIVLAALMITAIVINETLLKWSRRGQS